jgi:hypothetical protein
MGLLDSLRQAIAPAGPSDPALKGRYDAWRRLPDPDLDADHLLSRYVVVDVEASGLDAANDRLISIGAVAVDRGLIEARNAFEVVLRQDQVSTNDNILIHGIGASAQREGADPAEAMLDFLEFAGKSPLVAFHAFFDETMIGRAAPALDRPCVDPARPVPGWASPDHGPRSLAADLRHPEFPAPQCGSRLLCHRAAPPDRAQPVAAAGCGDALPAEATREVSTLAAARLTAGSGRS